VYGCWGEVIARLDLADRELRLGVEADGAAYHRGRAAQDRARDLRTGWTIERVTWFQVRCQPEQVLARVLRTAAALRRAAP
jgi:very-short-patch-repair endonuclease